MKKAARSASWQLPKLHGETFMVSGDFRPQSEEDFEQWITDEGGIIAAKMSRDVSYLVVDSHESDPSKLRQQAEKLNQTKQAGIQIIDAAQLQALLLPTPEETLAMIKAGRAGSERWKHLVRAGRFTEKLIELPPVDLRGIELEEFDLRCVTLNGADFRQAKFKKVTVTDIHDGKFDEVVAEDSIITGRRCSFRGAKLDLYFDDTIYDSDFDDAELQARVKSENCTFRRATISGGIDEATNSNFDNVQGSGKWCLVQKLTDCTAQKINLHAMDFGRQAVFIRSDLSEADIAESQLEACRAEDSRFVQADLRNSELAESKFLRCDFTGANLSVCGLNNVDFTGSTLAGVNFAGSNLSQAKLCQADLTGANFRDAWLDQADLTGAIVKDADFTGAKLRGACLDGVDVSQAVGLAEANLQPQAVGPNIKTLDDAVHQAEEIRSSIQADTPRGRIRLYIVGGTQNGNTRAACEIQTSSGLGRKGGWGPGNTIPDCLAALGLRHADAQPDFSTLDVEHKKSPLKIHLLKEVVRAAWQEAFGLETASPAAQEQQASVEMMTDKQLRTEWARRLATEPDSIPAWRELTDLERKRIKHFHGVDFSHADLREVHLPFFDLTDCNFTGANLERAHLQNAKLKNVSFRDANLADSMLMDMRCLNTDFTGANLRNAWLRAIHSLTEANFHQADLSGTDFSFTNLRGADLSTAKLEGAVFFRNEFDETTRLPPGVQLPDEATWTGDGPDPRTGVVKKKRGKKTTEKSTVQKTAIERATSKETKSKKAAAQKSKKAPKKVAKKKSRK